MKKILLSIAGPVLTGLFGVLTLPILSWMTTPEALGGVALFVTIVSFLAIVFTLGLDAAITREFYESENRAALTFSLTASSLMFAVLALSVAVMFSEPGVVNSWFPSSPTYLIWILAAAALAELASKFMLVSLRLHGYALGYSLGLAGPKALYLVLLIGSFFVVGELHFINIAIMFLVAKVLTLVSLLAVFSGSGIKKLSWQTCSCDRAVLYKSLWFGLPLVVTGVAGLAMKSLDKILLARLSTFEELAVFAISVSLAVSILLVHSVMTTLWIPAVYKWVAIKDAAKKLEMSRRVVVAFCALAGLIAIMVSPLVTLFLPDFYQPVVIILPLCITAYLMYVMALVTGVNIKISRKTNYSMTISLLCVVLNAVLNFWLIPLFGALGAALATMLSFVIFLLLSTEAASYLGGGFSRGYVYSYTLLMTISAVVWALYGGTYPLLLLSATLVLIVGLGTVNLKYFKQAWSEVKSSSL